MNFPAGLGGLASVPLGAIELEQSRRRCLTLAGFAREAWDVLEPSTPLKWGWCLDAICEHLEAVSNGDIRRLLINVPPGSMKSLLAGVLWNAWEWGPKGHPELRFLGTAHKQDLAMRDNMRTRRLVQSQWFQERWPLALTSDQNAKGKFENSATGFREAMAFTSLTGSRGDRVILDDPHSVDDANSKTVLEGDIRTFREALPSRVNNEDSAIVIIMQRLNELDVSACALELGYEHLCIPMRYEAGRNSATVIGWRDPRTIDGELMFPERFPLDQVIELETSLGSYASAGQLQQRPAPREGGMFKRRWFDLIDAAPAALQIVRAWDLAGTVAKAGSDPDWTVGTKMGRDGQGFLYILDVVRFRGTPDAVERTILNTAKQDGKIVSIRVPQDPGQAGKAQAGALTRMLGGYIVTATPPTGSKETRASPFAAQCEAGNVKLVRGPWIEAFLDELDVFPFGRHDDQVDATADAFNALFDTSGSAGFLGLVRVDNAAKQRDIADNAAALAAIKAAECPYAIGSVEYQQFHIGKG